MIKIVNTLEELDDLIPLFYEARDIIPSNGTMSGFIGWLVLNIFGQSLRIWGVYEHDQPIGMAIACIEVKYFQPECTVIVAYSSKNCNNEFQKINEEVDLWAKSKNCKKTACYSTRNGLMRKYGFKAELMYLTREVV